MVVRCNVARNKDEKPLEVFSLAPFMQARQIEYYEMHRDLIKELGQIPDSFYFEEDGHPSAVGARVIADYIHKRILQ
jgi:hypothetical protein